MPSFVTEKPETVPVLNCDDHGEYMVRYVKWFNGKFMVSECCPECAKAEKLQEERDQADAERERKEENTRRLKMRSGLSPRNINVRFKDYDQSSPEKKNAHDCVKSFAKSIYDGYETPSLILSGKVGTGKTMLACATMNALMPLKSCHMIKLIDMFREIKNTWRKDSERSEIDLLNFFSKVDLLIIDEVGVNFDSDTEKMFIFDVIDGRYQNMKPTMIISNLNIDGISAIMGERVIDRLRDGGGDVVAFDWESHRK